MNRYSKKIPPAVIVGFETNALGVSRTLFDYGIPSIGIAEPTPHPAHFTRTARVRRLRSWSEEHLLGELLSIGPELEVKSPLLMTKDEAVIWVSKHRAELAQYYQIALPSPETVELLMNKAAFLDYAERHQLPIPKSWKLATMDELQAIENEIPFPCIIKPQVKNSEFRAHCNQKAYVAADFAQLSTFYREIGQWEPEVVVQEWVPGGDDRIAFALAYYTKDGAQRGMFCGRKLRQWPVGCGNTALCETAPAAWEEKIVPLTAGMFQEWRYSGLGSIEYKMHPDGDRPYIMEPTVGRTNYQNEIAVLNGCPLPLFAYSDLSGIEIAPLKRRFTNTKLVDGLAELRSAKTRVHLKEISVGDAIAQRLGRKRYMLFRLSDPRPFLRWLRAGLLAKAELVLRKIGICSAVSSKT